ncbi:MAG TPA: hypothetical protein VFA27_02510 [Vicinamibacterales bacterium]|nr:hypothetical protein [Vicinamibacterales bacterium]
MTFDDLPPSATPRPREKLFEFLRGHDRWLCELVDLERWGVEAQFFKNEEFNRSRRFDRSEQDHGLARELAILWATGERRAIERGGA